MSYYICKCLGSYIYISPRGFIYHPVYVIDKSPETEGPALWQGLFMYWIYHLYSASIGSISNLYHIETVNYNSILCKLFWYNMQVLCKLLFTIFT